jgi:predicted DnaQ family exonuclease/DinG family helicase
MNSWTPPPLPPGLPDALDLRRFVAFDVETTGLDPLFDQMIEVGVVRFENGVETDIYTSFIACPGKLPANIVKLTGITDEMLKGQPDEASVLPELMDFIGDDPIVGQNVSFDLSFLREALKRQGESSWLGSHQAVDTALLARVLLPTLPSKGLSSLARYFNIDVTESHRATPDALRAGQVLLCLLSYFNKVDIKTVDLLRRIADGLYHPSAWIFSAWADYLIQTSAVEGRFQAHQLPYLTDNILGRLPSAASIEATEAQIDEDARHEPIDGGEIASFFTAASPLKKVFPRYEHRPQQEEMAAGVTESLNQGGLLAVEAGTGVGKSMAYLIPAVCWAQANRDLGERVIVSTNTKNLQEQLFYKDLPSLVDVVPVKFSAVLLKGRNNYLCRRRWQNLTTNHPIRLPQYEKLALLSLVLWTEQTRTGDVSEVGGIEGRGSLWARIGSEAGSCRGRRCRERNRCFHTRIRTAAARAHIVIVNHALLMADIAADRVPIGAYSTLVIDEAHHLERAASQHLGNEINAWMFRSWAGRMYDLEGVPTGLLAQVLLGIGTARSDHPSLPGLTSVVEHAAEGVLKLRSSAESFFIEMTAKLRSLVPRQENAYTQKLRLLEPDQFLLELEQPDSALEKSVKATMENFTRIIETLGDIPMAVLPQVEDWTDDLRGARDELEAYLLSLQFFQSLPDENWVYWAEIPQNVDHQAILYAAPLNAGEILKQQLFDPLRTGIMTSATLTVADRFHYFLRKVGLKEAESLSSMKLGSPFDFDRQMLIGLAAYLPTPKSVKFEPEATALIQALLREFNHGTLGLFTSYRMLRKTGEALGEELPGDRLLIQGQDGSRDHLLRQFRESPGSVLLGTDSFWEGIDVVGEALELLVVAKLPFEVPSEPIVEARLEKLQREGKDGFMYYTVPEAVIRLRQGIGRLIRSTTDRGAALILDSRLAKARYSDAFFESLPVPVRIFQNEEDTISEIKSFLNGVD